MQFNFANRSNLVKLIRNMVRTGAAVNKKISLVFVLKLITNQDERPQLFHPDLSERVWPTPGPPDLAFIPDLILPRCYVRRHYQTQKSSLGQG